jgi:hypothetical protein
MHQLRRRMLPEINAHLARPIQMGLKKPLQKSYPHIHGLYLLVRASGLTCVEGTAKKPLLAIDDALYGSWQGLNATERYCTLLETWLLWGRHEVRRSSLTSVTGGSSISPWSVSTPAYHLRSQ